MKLFRKLFPFLSLIFIFFYSYSNAGVIKTWDGILYVVEKDVTIEWNLCAGADYYEVQALWIDPSNEPVIFNIGKVTENRIIISKPKVGHFFIRIRSCNESGCGDWSETIDATKTKIGKPFRIYFKLSPVSNVGIE